MRTLALLPLLAAAFAPAAAALAVEGSYLESRTCQVYTGPCFANSETALAGKDAILAWGIESGEHAGVDLSGLNVVVVVAASDTLGYEGLRGARSLKALVLLDQRADEKQREALLDFARTHSGPAGEHVVRVESVSIDMSLDTAELAGQLTAGRSVKLTTRAARRGDCICSNEVAFYPPLAEVESFAPGVTMEGEFRGRGLGTRWSTPQSRSAYMGLFRY